MKTVCLLLCMAYLPPAVGQNIKRPDEFAFTRNYIKSTRTFVPKSGIVPDKGTAIAIAYAVAVPVYGKQQTDAEKPFRAELKDGKWIVLGTLRPAGILGGTVIVQIDQRTGKVDYLNHSQ